MQQGTTNKQRAVTGTLETLPPATFNTDIKPPTLIIVGEVVNLCRQLGRFERQAACETTPEPFITPVRA